MILAKWGFSLTKKKITKRSFLSPSRYCIGRLTHHASTDVTWHDEANGVSVVRRKFLPVHFVGQENIGCGIHAHLRQDNTRQDTLTMVTTPHKENSETGGLCWLVCFGVAPAALLLKETGNETVGIFTVFYTSVFNNSLIQSWWIWWLTCCAPQRQIGGAYIFTHYQGQRDRHAISARTRWPHVRVLFFIIFQQKMGKSIKKIKRVQPPLCWKFLSVRAMFGAPVRIRRHQVTVTRPRDKQLWPWPWPSQQARMFCIVTAHGGSAHCPSYMKLSNIPQESEPCNGARGRFPFSSVCFWKRTWLIYILFLYINVGAFGFWIERYFPRVADISVRRYIRR